MIGKTFKSPKFNNDGIEQNVIPFLHKKLKK